MSLKAMFNRTRLVAVAGVVALGVLATGCGSSTFMGSGKGPSGSVGFPENLALAQDSLGITNVANLGRTTRSHLGVASLSIASLQATPFGTQLTGTYTDTGVGVFGARASTPTSNVSFRLSGVSLSSGVANTNGVRLAGLAASKGVTAGVDSLSDCASGFGTYRPTAASLAGDGGLAIVLACPIDGDLIPTSVSRGSSFKTEWLSIILAEGGAFSGYLNIAPMSGTLLAGA